MSQWRCVYLKGHLCNRQNVAHQSAHIKSASTMVSQLSLGRSLTEDLYNPKRIYMSIDSGSKFLTWTAHANCNAFPRVDFPPTLDRDPVGHFEQCQIITCMFYMTGIHSPNLQAKNAKAGERTINSSHKPSSAPSKYTTMHHFATEMYISVTKWCIVGYGTGALWDLYIVLAKVSYQHHLKPYYINSFPPSAAYMRQWIGWALVQIMACRLFGTKPLSKPMLGYCQLDL